MPETKPRTYYNKTFKEYVRYSVSVARDLGYKDKYIERIKKAKTQDEITCILSEARHDI